jgi:hypothetical protein
MLSTMASFTAANTGPGMWTEPGVFAFRWPPAIENGSERVSAEHGVRPTLLDAPVDDQYRRLALLVDSGIDLGIGHQLDFDRPVLLLRHRCASRREHTGHRHGKHHPGRPHALHPFELTTINVSRRASNKP